MGSSNQRGLSLVELMVGIAVGLFVVAGASLVVSTQLGENRRLLLETQLQQDLRATADIIGRELRRPGAMGNAGAIVWHPGGVAQLNPLAGIDVDAEGTQVTFRYERAPGILGPFGFKLEDGVVKSLLGESWQELTDRNVMRVTEFSVTPTASDPVTIPCPRACSADPLDTTCWPTFTVRSFTVQIEAVSQNDADVRRSITSQIRTKNDLVASNLPAAPLTACPL